MAYYELKPAVRKSHRNPFYGYGVVPKRVERDQPYTHPVGYDRNPPYDPKYWDVRGFGEANQGSAVGSFMGWASPLLKGLVLGGITYVAANAVGVKEPDARKVALVMGAMEAFVVWVGDWVRSELKEMQQPRLPAKK